MSLDVHLENEYGWVYSANITHNLRKMAIEAGVYDCCWHPEKETGEPTLAKELVPSLLNGIRLMLADPPRFEAFNSDNGWGLYENFLPWLIRYLRACQDNPEAKVSVSR